MKKLMIAFMCAAMTTCAPAHADYASMDEVQILRQMCVHKMRLAMIVMNMRQDGLDLEQQFETIAKAEDGDSRDYVSTLIGRAHRKAVGDTLESKNKIITDFGAEMLQLCEGEIDKRGKAGVRK